MKLKIFYANKLLSTWIISCIYFCAINPIYVIRADDSNNFECGIQFVEDSTSDSLFVRAYEYPWKAAVFKIRENKTDRFIGAGNLVNKNTILTMAHNIKPKYSRRNITTEQWKIVLGLRNLTDANETGRREFTVKNIVVHPRWNVDSDNFEGDIAIITLTEDVTFSKYIRPICLPDESIASITTGQISSWAPYDNANQYSETPRRKEIQINKDRECFRKDPALTIGAWDESFCAGAEGYSFCRGSAGNGFYVQRNGKFYLSGMVSSAVVVTCGEPNIALLTDVLEYREFLEENDVHSSTPSFECGIQSLKKPSSDVLFVRQYEYPWKAAIFKVDLNQTESFYATGSLVNKNTILTLAHKIKHKQGSIREITSEQFKIVLGLRNLNDANETGRREFTVKNIVVDPRWNISSDNYEGDIAIITLTEDVTFSKYIRPICLPDESIASITTGQISSWAAYDTTDQFSEIPRRNEIQIVGDLECWKKDRGLASIAWDESFCAGAEGYSICRGSQGNGLYVEKNGKFFLRGIVSIGADVRCGEPNIALFTDVLLYRDFLEENDVFYFTPDLSHSNDDCGIPSAVVGLVSHGDEVRHGLLPWLVALMKHKNNKFKFICGGTLVSAKIVVTAAHCIHNKQAHKGLKYHELRVVLGAHDLSDLHELGKKTLRIEKIVVHSTWDPADERKFTGDIALLVLDRNVAFGDYIKPVCLSESLPSFQYGVVAGWGRRENQKIIGTSNNTPRKIKIPLVSKNTCYEKEPLLANAGWDESYCAGRENVSVCDGDSGSGFYVKVNGKYYFKGIVSSAVLHEECVNGFYAIFTDAVKYIPFITGSEIVSNVTSTTSTTPSTRRTPSDDRIFFPDD